jgi:hypothetical protein
MNEDFVDFVDYDQIISIFRSKMMLSTLFRRLPGSFTYEQFKSSFVKTFTHMEMEEVDVEEAFVYSLELELIERVEHTDEYQFNGIALPTDELN